MKRLWVRLSLMISGVLFLMFFIQFLSISLEPEPIGREINSPPNSSLPPRNDDRAEISRRLIDFALLSLVIGTVGGIVIGRVVTRPVNQLVKAADRIRSGDLSVRVPAHGSQELVDLANTFNQMAADLQHAEMLRNNLMADVSHELRTPLTVLEGNLRAALDRIYTLDEAEIANLYGQTHHLIRLVNDLRELALAEAHQLPLEKQPTDLKLLVAEVVAALEPLSTEKGMHLLDQTPQLPQVAVDEIRIRQVLINLLSNAIQHTPNGGQVTLKGDSRPGEVFLLVQDNGEGIESEHLSAVFDRFYRVDKSRSRETGGSGLGLAITRAIIEAHGGHIEVASEGKDRGSTFTISLPV